VGSVAVFAEAPERLCVALRKGDKVYVEGTLRLSEWTGKGGEKRLGLSVAAWKAEKLGAIGRNKPAKTKPADAGPEAEPAEAVTSNGHGRMRQVAVDELIPF